MARRGGRDRGKEWQWRRVLRQWRRSGQSIRAYCLEHGLSEPSFYAWRRTVQERDRQAVHQPQRGRQHSREAIENRAGRGGSGGLPVFVPVTVAAAPLFEVVLGDSRVVRVPTGFDLTSLRQLLAVLEEARPC
jgi:transposase-like protein